VQAIGWNGLDYGQERIWTVWKPRDSDQAKIGLANGQPGSDTNAVGAGFLGHEISRNNPSCHHQPQDYCSLVDTSLIQNSKQLQEFEYKTIKVY
jgi:hypothetical protein